MYEELERRERETGSTPNKYKKQKKQKGIPERQNGLRWSPKKKKNMKEDPQ